jgi:hypothetical protein
MAKRFTSTEIWDEDWYLEMPIEYKLFWHFVLASCDHAGIFKVNIRQFCGLNGITITAAQALEFFNKGKGRIRVISDSIWFIEEFFVFQYGASFNLNNKLHESILKILKSHGIEHTSLRGLQEVKKRTRRPLEEDFDTLKDKDKDSLVGADIGNTGTGAQENLTEGRKQFDEFWETYGKGERLYECQHAWFAMSPSERKKALDEAKAYVQLKPEINFRASPYNWLSKRMWDDDYTGQLRKHTHTPEGKRKVVL